ncbi:hypothetical protein [Hyalangium sp.]|uniref:hypothetical protein n=1 Tax=Hyalangium sp. TaxID=2028555 RepID=UPI002D795D28|nr:hypothetical protein [Hyalangium sp.]
MEEDDYSQPLLAHQRTPEHERWRSAWKKALAWEQWDQVLAAVESAFPENGVRDATQPWHSACRRCCLYVKEALPAGGQTVIRIVAAASVLAPLYVTYVTTRTLKPGARASSPQLTFEPPQEAKPQVDALTRVIERELGYRPFPLELAEVTLPDVRVGYRNSLAPPTLLDALFSDDLANLP